MKIKEGDKEVLFYISMPPTYSEFGPPKYELSAPWLDRKAKAKLLHELDTISIENIGEVSVYLLIEHIRSSLESYRPLVVFVLNCPEITHGDVIVDRKSVFQGHAAEVHSLDDVKSVLAKLKENKKISSAKHNMMKDVEALNAIYNDVWTVESKATRSYSMRIKEGDKEVLFYITMPPTYPEFGPPKYELSAPWLGRKAKAKLLHELDMISISVLAKLKENKKISSAKHNMYAYRMKESTAKGTEVVLQDFDEDGEAHAGSRLMHLMKVMDLDNTLVIVTRW
ncbi:unnamed protein product [Diatraea saccharalis]|uniref:RWD domain-containing protein n=1 Tax=Diatraea saccharalis TaxID=40085 RepID=A0A9N9WHV1_9NEOP|nr:unnamed protein product [Diatraea saccharalis]